MGKHLQIHIPEACSESWNEMLPNSQGKHCLNCQKTVVDFTGMTDTELVNFFKNNNNSTCGRFTNDQLQRKIPIPKKQIHWVKYFFQIVLPAFFLSSKVAAQNDSVKASMEIRDTTPNEKIADTLSNIPIDTIELGTETFSKDTLPSLCIKEVIPNVEPETWIFMGNTITTMGLVNIVNPPPIIDEVFQDYAFWGTKKQQTSSQPPNFPNIPSPTVVTLFPNPIKSGTTLHIHWKNAEAGDYHFTIANFNGTILQKGKLYLEDKTSTSFIALKEMPSGNYVLTIVHEPTQEKWSQPFVVF